MSGAALKLCPLAPASISKAIYLKFLELLQPRLILGYLKIKKDSLKHLGAAAAQRLYEIKCLRRWVDAKWHSAQETAIACEGATLKLYQLAPASIWKAIIP